MLGGHFNEKKITRSMEAELKKTFDDDDFEFWARRIYGLCDNKDNPYVNFSLDHKQVIEFQNYEDARLHVIEYETKFLGNKQLKAADLARNNGRLIKLDATHPKDRKKTKELIPKHHRNQSV